MERMGNGIDTGIKDSKRVKEHGEVFTPDKIVNDMLDLTDANIDKNDIYKYINTTFLEPSCGNGNFLLRIIDRKLEAVQKLETANWFLGLIQALTSVYGVDIQDDNIVESKKRIKELITTGYTKVLDLKDVETAPFRFKKFELSPEQLELVDFVLDRNIQCGNTLTGKKVVNGKESEELIVSEWKWNGETVTRRDVLFSKITNDADNTFRRFEEINFCMIPYCRPIPESDMSGEASPGEDF